MFTNFFYQIFNFISLLFKHFETINGKKLFLFPKFYLFKLLENFLFKKILFSCILNFN